MSSDKVVSLDDQYMSQAITLARKGLGRTSPNPVVGAVIVRNGQVIGRGFHQKYGEKHAEINAIEDAGGDVEGATLYVTLEPCCHQPKHTPPCVDALIKNGISRVVLGTLDPNPLVNGKGSDALRTRGVKVALGVMGEECAQLNEPYFKHITTGLPLVTIKWAQTLNGRIATMDGISQWISSPPSLRLAHRLRRVNDAVMVGIGTVLADDPKLTTRLVEGRSPIPVIVDSVLRIPLDSQVLHQRRRARVIIATTTKANAGKVLRLKQAGVDVVVVGEDVKGQVDLSKLLEELGKKGITSILVEGGAALITSLLRQGLADRAVVFVAPKILGEGLGAVGNIGVKDIAKAVPLRDMTVRRLGEDLIVEGRVSKA